MALQKSGLNTKIWLRVPLGGLSGAVAWYVGMLVFFGPAQAILANPEYQSAKFLKVFTELQPYPHTARSPWILFIGLFIIATFYSLGFKLLWKRLPINRWKRGAFFGLISWLLMTPWFEFYLPWNVMHEPFSLVMLEGTLWFFVLQLVGISISWCYPLKRD